MRVLFCVFLGCTPLRSDPLEGLQPEIAQALRELAPNTLPSPPADISNLYADSENAAQLGQALFFDAGLSGALIDGDNDGSPETLGERGQAGRVACAGCHMPEAGFSDVRSRGRQISLAAGWAKRRTPSLLDVGQAQVLMWDGHHDTMFNQVFGPFESSVEMNSSRLFVAQQIIARYRTPYEAVFGPLPAVAPGPPLAAESAGCDAPGKKSALCHGRPGTTEYDGLLPEDQEAVTRIVVNVGKAIGAYERRLTCGAGRFDAWVHGDETALTAAEQRGAQLFVGRAKCVTCHSGPMLSDQRFHNVGLTPIAVAITFDDFNDSGASVGLVAARADPLNVRGKFSDGDDGRLDGPTPLPGTFRTPTLRCVASRPSFFHTGQTRKLSDVVHFFASAPASGGFVGISELHPLGLTVEDEADLTAFLLALEGPGPASHLRSTPH